MTWHEGTPHGSCIQSVNSYIQVYHRGIQLLQQARRFTHFWTTCHATNFSSSNGSPGSSLHTKDGTHADLLHPNYSLPTEWHSYAVVNKSQLIKATNYIIYHLSSIYVQRPTTSTSAASALPLYTGPVWTAGNSVTAHHHKEQAHDTIIAAASGLS